MKSLEEEILTSVRELDEPGQRRLLTHIRAVINAPSDEEFAAMAAEAALLYVPGGELDMTGELEFGERLRYARALLEVGAPDDWAVAAEALKDLYVANGPLDLWGEIADAEASQRSRSTPLA